MIAWHKFDLVEGSQFFFQSVWPTTPYLKCATSRLFLVLLYVHANHAHHHGIIQIHNNVLWETISRVVLLNIFHIQTRECGEYLGILRGILLIPQNIVMDMDNAMLLKHWVNIPPPLCGMIGIPSFGATIALYAFLKTISSTNFVRLPSRRPGWLCVRKNRF
jgi:hypothetical protein